MGNPFQGFGLYSAMLADSVGRVKGEVMANKMAEERKLTDFSNMMRVKQFNGREEDRAWGRERDVWDRENRRQEYDAEMAYKLGRDKTRNKLDFMKMTAKTKTGKANGIASLSPAKQFNETEKLQLLQSQREKARGEYAKFSSGRSQKTADTGTFVEDHDIMEVDGKPVNVGEYVAGMQNKIKDFDSQIAIKEALLNGRTFKSPEKHLKQLRPDKNGQITVKTKAGKQKVDRKEYSAQVRAAEGFKRLKKGGMEQAEKYLSKMNISDDEKRDVARKMAVLSQEHSKQADDNLMRNYTSKAIQIYRLKGRHGVGDYIDGLDIPDEKKKEIADIAMELRDSIQGGI